MLPAPTALHAVIAGTVPDGAIGTGKLADLSVTGDKIANNTISVAKLTGAGANFWDGNGTSVWRTGGNVGIGTASPVTALHVLSAVSTEISVDSTAATGGKRYTLQSGSTGRFSIIDRDAGVSRFSVEANGNIGIVPTSGNVGIGTISPNAKLDVAGNIIENGQHVPSSAEDLRIIRGGGTANVPVDGINRPPSHGSGFTYKKISDGVVDVTFTTPFAGTPTVTANPRANGAIFCGLEGLGGATNPGTTGFRIVMFDTNSNVRNWPFNFIAIGPR